jgi:hypothetical protein
VRVFNPALSLVVADAVALLVAAVAAPGLRDLFRFGELHPDDVAVVIVASTLALLWLEVLRAVRARLRPGSMARHPANTAVAPSRGSSSQ